MIQTTEMSGTGVLYGSWYLKQNDMDNMVIGNDI
jgi:hypothetical protein